MKADCLSLVNKEKIKMRKRLKKLEKREELTLHGKTLPVAPHMKMLKPICV